MYECMNGRIDVCREAWIIRLSFHSYIIQAYTESPASFIHNTSLYRESPAKVREKRGGVDVRV
jgi:hypothetical protein